jgi:DNA-binding NarL/FixJ family response regulator
VRTALVCVRTPVAAQSIAACASRLGVSTVRTAVSEAEVLAQLAERPAELVLADTAVTKPDTVGFTRRVLALAPAAVLLLLGTEEPRVAAAAVAAGARGLIRTGDYDVVGTVTKALLLLGSRAPAPAAAAGGCGGQGQALRAAAARRAGAPAGPAPAGGGGLPMVPAQRADLSGPADRRGVRHATLTERELQVLRGMAEGKSNAEIGRDLFVSEDTVKTHARRLFRKLRARDRAHAVAVGFRSGTLS